MGGREGRRCSRQRYLLSSLAPPAPPSRREWPVPLGVPELDGYTLLPPSPSPSPLRSILLLYFETHEYLPIRRIRKRRKEGRKRRRAPIPGSEIEILPFFSSPSLPLLGIFGFSIPSASSSIEKEGGFTCLFFFELHPFCLSCRRFPTPDLVNRRERKREREREKEKERQKKFFFTPLIPFLF